MCESRFVNFLSGLGIGLAVALLWAPKSGAETRSAIRGSMAEGQRYLIKQGAEIGDAISGTFERGRDTLERGKEAARKTKEGVIEAIEQGKATFRNSPASHPRQSA